MILSKSKIYEKRLIISEFSDNFYHENFREDYPDIGMENSLCGHYKKLVGYFIRKGADCWEDGLVASCFIGDLALVKYFLNQGADDFDSAPMNAAVKGRSKEVIDHLISRSLCCADVGLNTSVHDGILNLFWYFYSLMKNISWKRLSYSTTSNTGKIFEKYIKNKSKKKTRLN